MVNGSVGGWDEDRVPPDLARPDPLEATAPAIDVSGPAGEGFVFAVSEATTNAVRHGWPPVRVRM